MTGRGHRSSPPPDRGAPTTRGPGGIRALLTVRSVAGRVFLVELLIVLVLVAAAVAAMVLQARSSTVSDARRVTRGVAESFAHAPGVAAALDGPDPSATLQPLAEEVRRTTGVDGLLVFSNSFVQLTSPYPDYVGRPYQPPAYVVQKVVPELRAGRTVTFTLEEPGYRAIATAVPVFGPDGSPKGVVSANITVEKVDAVVGSNLPVLLGGAAGAVALGALGTALVARRLLRQTRGLGPADMTRMYEHHDAVLHAVREGVLIVSSDGRLVLANDEAKRLLALPADPEWRPVAELGLDGDTLALLTSSEDPTDRVHPAGDRLLVVNKRPTAPYGGLPSSVVTLRDTTELFELAGRVEVADLRRRLVYDAGLAVGSTLDPARTCEELAAVAVPRFADAAAVDLLEAVTRGEEPDAADGRLRRAAFRGPQAEPDTGPDAAPRQPAVGERVEVSPTSPQARVLADGRALIAPAEPGSDTAAPSGAAHAADAAVLVVPLLVRGVVLGLVEFRRGPGRVPFDAEDLSLAEDLAARAAVAVDNARRYRREHRLAVTLQRSLLPSRLPDQAALEVASHYRPAHSGVGGDWFDVIPLSGFRTALVVGDVVGHGIRAAVAMGRLRTAVRTFSALDLPPDEVLGRLDELVTQLDAEAEDGGITGSTCLYAVYDPVSGVCGLARAGHPGPALVAPGGTVTYPEVAVSPPLGVGGLPVDVTELHLAAGSQLVLFTDGLVESRTRDLDLGLERLRRALTGDGSRGPEEICRAVTGSVLPDRPADDVALLVARTRRLEPDRVAEWEVPMDPSAVSPVRSACARRLEEWGLGETVFTTELILSELITNAIRYGAPPVRVRLLRDRSLVCEVSDGNSTAPHLRWAASTDEGGRGLYLVAQLAHRWGTRHTATGKVIWSEQLLPEGPGPAG
ncbi:SpoIIE family protein phosphatase [Kitasatospora camelliae]|uniref:protein-serine/threonine phosphatase n=1 Tax=Kitasatospora camelliae TaxID=3156397 RepID=A0AAU8K3R2_9ACTN